MSYSLTRGSQKKVICRTTDDIDKYFIDPDITHIEVSPGTYTWSSVTSVVIYDNRYIRFVGDVLFQNAYFISRASNDSDFYATAANTVSWNSGSSRFERSGGDSWSTSWTDWQIFVRDAWYTCSSITADYFYPNEECYADGISGDLYVLAKPTQNVHIEGLVRVEHTTGTGVMSDFSYYGSGCNLSKWKIRFEEATSARTGYGVSIWNNCNIILPEIEILFYEHDASNTRGAISAGHLHSCTARNWRVSNCLKQDSDNDYGVQGIRIATSENSRFVDCYVAAVTRMDQDVGTPAANSYQITTDTSNCLVHGHSIAPYSEYGAENHYENNGTNNTIDLVQVAS